MAAAVGELVAGLERFDPRRPALSWLVDELRAATESERAAAFAFREAGDRFEIDFDYVAGDGASTAGTLLRKWVGTNRRTPGCYDPQSPEPWQRNRVLACPSPSGLQRGEGSPTLRRRLQIPDERMIETWYKPSNSDRPTARVLICDGASLLTWFGVFDTDGVGPRHTKVLRTLAEPLRRRLTLERLLADSAARALALEAALELVPNAAFVVSGRNVILAANAIGRAELAADRQLRGQLTQLGGPDPNLFTVTRMEVDATTHFLALRRLQDRKLQLLALEARRWALTPRETEVAGWLVRAATNRKIADELGCAEHTVELHVSRVLAKARVASRTELILLLLEAT